jgi:signal transduction histidine kinase
MFSRTRGNPFGSITVRLTLWYGCLFGGLSLAVFLFTYVSLVSSLDRRAKDELLETGREFEALWVSEGVEALQSEFEREAASRGVGNAFFRLSSAAGDVFASSDLSGWKERWAPRLDGGGDGPAFRTTELPGHRASVSAMAMRLTDGNVLLVAITLGDDAALKERYRESFTSALAIMLTSGGLIGWLLARWSMSGVERVTQTAVRIGRGDLSLRVPVAGEGREIENLAHAFNDMLERLETLVGELEEVTDSVAHDLRGPITRMRGLAESCVLGEGDLDAYRRMASVVVEESDRLVGMVDTMLEIARANSGVLRIAASEIDVRDLVTEAVELFSPLAEEGGIRLETGLPSQPVAILGDRQRLQRVVASLLDNAIKYTPAAGRVTVVAASDGPQARIEVRDTGCGISREDLPRIFDRFYRGEKSRSSPGNGLGLSLAAAIVRLHGGDLEVHSSPGRGSTFIARLPRAPGD